MADASFRCPCCGARTLSTIDSMELCPVCWWEEDGQSARNAAEVCASINGQLSLCEARQNYQICGAAHPRFAHYVRKALPDEQ